MFKTSRQAGMQGEQLALRYLQAQGLQLQLRNYRCARGEIDLVMRDGATLVLVEVRLRRDRDFGGAAASVTAGKQQRLIKAAQHLLLTHAKLRDYPARFDLVAIDGAALHVEWIKDAFRLA